MCINANFSKTCDATKIVNGISKNHLKGKTNDDVLMIVFNPGQNVSKIPENIGRIFPNLEGIYLPKAGIKKISNRDIKQFPELKYLQLSYNNLVELDGNLFDFNPDLKLIGIDHNQIANVGSNIFEPITNLTVVNLGNNKCGDFKPIMNGEKQLIAELEKLLATNCAPTAEMKEKAEPKKKSKGKKSEDDDNDDSGEKTARKANRKECDEKYYFNAKKVNSMSKMGQERL